MELANVDQEYEKCKELKKEDVKKIMEWVELQPHLPKLTEMQVCHFLHSNMFSSEAAKSCIDRFFTVRTHCPEFFANRNPEKVNLDTLLYVLLPKTTPEGYRVIYCRLIDTNPKDFSVDLLIKILDMSTMLMLNRQGTMPGQVVIHDLKGLSFAHIAKLNPLLLKKFFYYLQECMPVRVKGLHFINTGNVIDKILMLIKPFMKKELINVIFTHPNNNTIYDHLSKECLPSDFEGGEAPSFLDLYKTNKKDLLAFKDFFIAEEKQKVDESKRPGKPTDVGELWGVEGTFKKLDID